MSMRTCRRHGDCDVVHDRDVRCPLCELQDKKRGLESYIAELECQIEEFEYKVMEYEHLEAVIDRERERRRDTRENHFWERELVQLRQETTQLRKEVERLSRVNWMREGF